MKIHEKITRELFARFNGKNEWRYFIAHPCLLLKRQLLSSDNVTAIATVASHNLGRHKFCDGYRSEKCYKVQDFIRKSLISELLNTIQNRIIELPQKSFL